MPSELGFARHGAESAALARLEETPSLTPDAERFWIGETVAEEIERARARKTSLEIAARTLAARYPAAPDVSQFRRLAGSHIVARTRSSSDRS